MTSPKLANDPSTHPNTAKPSPVNQTTHPEPILRIPWGLGNAIRQQLLDDPQRERFAFGIARPLQRGAGYEALLEHLIPMGSLDYDHSSAGSLSLNAAASATLNQWAARIAEQGWIPVHLHSHPPGANGFSGTDDHFEHELSTWLAAQGHPQFWSLVWPHGHQPLGRLWIQGQVTTGELFLGLSSTATLPDLPPEALDRQRAFGTALHHSASRLRVGLLGVGGLGMLVAEQLARAGFNHFVLIDPDRIEVTNLNRLPGTTRRDLGRYKVAAAKRLIQQAARALGHDVRISAFQQDLYTSARARRALGRCDLILALTDNELSRTQALEIALREGCEYLQAGTDIRLTPDGRITGLLAEVTGAEIGRYCPICSGRLSPAQAALEARVYAGGEVLEHAKHQGYIPEVAAPAVMGLNAVAAGMLVTEIQRRAAGLGARDLLQLDLQTGHHSTVEQLMPTEACLVCGGG